MDERAIYNKVYDDKIDVIYEVVDDIVDVIIDDTIDDTIDMCSCKSIDNIDSCLYINESLNRIDIISVFGDSILRPEEVLYQNKMPSHRCKKCDSITYYVKGSLILLSSVNDGLVYSNYGYLNRMLLWLEDGGYDFLINNRIVIHDTQPLVLRRSIRNIEMYRLYYNWINVILKKNMEYFPIKVIKKNLIYIKMMDNNVYEEIVDDTKLKEITEVINDIKQMEEYYIYQNKILNYIKK